MKKIIVMTLIFALAATSAFAQGSSNLGTLSFTTTGKTLTADPTTATADTARIGKMSTGVDVGWATAKAGYAIMTQHISGTKAYGSSYDSTAIYQSVPTDTVPGDPAFASGVLTNSDTADFSDTSEWKAM